MSNQSCVTLTFEFWGIGYMIEILMNKMKCGEKTCFGFWSNLLFITCLQISKTLNLGEKDLYFINFFQWKNVII